MSLDPRPVDPRPLALVTGASSGIGRALAEEFLERGFDVVATAEDQGLSDVAAELARPGAVVRPVLADLRSGKGVEGLYSAVRIEDRPLAAAALNAGIGRGGGGFTETPLTDHLDVIRLNVSGTVHLAHLVLTDMLAAGAGRLLITSSMVAAMPGAYQVTYNGSKSFLQSFVEGLQEELKDSPVSVTSLMPGITDTSFFGRAQMDDARIARIRKDDPAVVARQGVDALLSGRRRVVGGSVLNRVGAAVNSVLPDSTKAKVQAVLSNPGR